jgi:prevent-host-death family protein
MPKTAKRHPGKKTRLRSGSEWQLQTAKARFSELFRKALADGPQRITRHGRDTVVVVAADEFDRLTRRSKQPESLVEFFRKSPLVGSGINLERERTVGRKVEL